MAGGLFPPGGGVARVDRQGYPVWFRHDYSHHWPNLVDGEKALVPAYRLDTDKVVVEMPGWTTELGCSGRMLDDAVNILDGDGDLVKQISVLNSIQASPYRGNLAFPWDKCDLTHLNYVDVVRQGWEDGDGVIEAGDIILSLRNLNAVGIIDGDSYELKRLVRGSFIRQHSVQQLDGSRFLMFDNLGGDEVGGPSRLLMVDLATGVETTLFPNRNTPKELSDHFSPIRGHVDISPDRHRAIVVFTKPALAIEVRIADGEVLNVFRSLHDLSGVDHFPDERRDRAAKFGLYGLDYLDGDARGPEQ